MDNNDSNNPHDEEQEPVVNTRDLVPIIKLSHQTQLNYMADPQRRHRMPPGAFKRPGGREWLWKLRDVLAWRDSGRRLEPPASPPPARRGRGRPKGSPNKKRRVEQIQAAKAGLQQGRA